MRLLRKLIALIIVILTIFTVKCPPQISIFTNANINGNNAKVTNVAVLLYSFDDLYMQQLKQGFENIQNANADKVRFSFFDGKNNIGVQEQTLDSLLNSNIDLFIMILADSKKDMVEDVISKVKPSNIPIVLINFDPHAVSNVPNYYDKTAFVVPDAYKEGVLQGEILINLWNTNKKDIDKNNNNILQYILLQGSYDSPLAVEKTQNFNSTINDSGIKTEILSQINVNWSKELAKSSIENLFLKYNGNIEAIICTNDVIALGAVEALQKYGYNTGDNSKYIHVIGTAGLQEAKDLIDKGFMTGTVVHNPKLFAEGFYLIGMNLVNNLNPIANTNYYYNNGAIIIPNQYEKYIKKD